MLAGAALLPAQPQPQAQAEPMRVTVTLVQVDAVVTDKAGRHVTDLTADDFEIYQDGRRQKVARSAYIPLVSGAPAGPRPTGPVPPPRPVREQIARTFAIIVNDWSLRDRDMPELRGGLHRFIDEQLQPSDLVAILCLGRNIGALNQFTADKRKLHTAVENIRVIPPRPLAFPVDADNMERMTYVAKAMRQLPGHKFMLLLSDHGLMGVGGEMPPPIVKATDELLDECLRSGTAIYTINSRFEIGFGNGTGAGADENGGNGQVVGVDTAGIAKTQSLVYMANSTGGKYVGGLNNELTTPLLRAMAEQQGYYLLAYTPDERSFRGGSWERETHSIKVKVKRPGCEVRASSAFRGVPDRPAAPRKPVVELLDAIGSPFGAPDIEAGISSVFFDGATGPAITSLVNVKAADLTMTERDGLRLAEGEVMIMVFGDNGQADFYDSVKFTARLNPADYARAMADGFLFTFHIPMKQPGAYDVRAAVRDAASRKMGTASAYVFVPRRNKNHVELSGILLQAPPKPGDSGADLRGASALRNFRPGDSLVYACQILNPKLDEKNPQLTLRYTIFRGGKPVVEGQPTPVKVEGDPRRIPAGGSLTLGPQITPGDYVLQVTATAPAAKNKEREATQTIDFYVR